MFDLSNYETVDQRLEKFWAKYEDGAILTELVAQTHDRYIVKASIYKTFADSIPFATGYAEETVSSRGVNSTSALENAESSAIGRALHTGGISKHSEGKPRPSREEMEKVAARTNNEQASKRPFQEKLAEKVSLAKEDDPWTTKTVDPAAPAADAVTLVKQVLGGKTQTDIPNCKCNQPMAWADGVSKAGKAWGHFKCSNVPSRKCQEPIWYNIAADGSWQPREAW